MRINLCYLKFTDKRLSPNDSRLSLNLIYTWFLQPYNCELLSSSQNNFKLCHIFEGLTGYLCIVREIPYSDKITRQSIEKYINFHTHHQILISQHISLSHSSRYIYSVEAWGSVVVKALRYYSDGPGIVPRWCYWGFFPWFLPTKPCVLRSTQPLKMSTMDFSRGNGGRCVWLTTYHPCSAESREDPGP